MARKSHQATPNASSGSILSPSLSLSSVSESVKTVPIKDEKVLVQPFKMAKTCPSTHSAINHDNQNLASQDTANNDEVSTLASNSSDIEIVEADPEKELGKLCLLTIFADCLQTYAFQRL
jgi:hypothetical protein